MRRLNCVSHIYSTFMPRCVHLCPVQCTVYVQCTAANTDLFNPLVPKAHNSECQNLPFPLQI